MARWAVLISGNGSTMQAALDTPELNQKVAVIIASSADAQGILRAKRFGVPVEVVPRELERKNEREAWIVVRLKFYSVKKIFLAGFMKILSKEFLENFGADSVFNIHPSKLPDFKGANGFGETLASGASHGGVTVHKVVPEIDSGAFILQRIFEIPPSREFSASELWLRINEQRVVRESLRRIVCSL
jgi:phosphoribosylglycinamide formyltransferase-1